MQDVDRRFGGGEDRVDLLHLPMPEATLFGRDEDRAWLERCWTEHAYVATIVAPGGVGKSALVCDWLRKVQAEGWREAERVYGWSFYSQGTTPHGTTLRAAPARRAAGRGVEGGAAMAGGNGPPPKS